MTTRNYSAKITLALWFSAAAWGAQQHAAPKAGARPGAKKAAAAPAAARPAATGSGLAGLVRDYRQKPTPARRAAIVAWGQAHSDDAPLVSFALGTAAYEQKDYATAIAALRKTKLPAIADYTAYYLAASELEAKDNRAAAETIAGARAAEVKSPVTGKSWLVEARALQDTQAAEAVRILKEHYNDLPQPDGDAALADCYQAANDLPHAADFYQRVFYQYPTGDAALKAAAALITLQDTMGTAYPAPLPQQKLRRADRLMEQRDYVHARAEYEAIASQAAALEREQARVRVGAADALAGRTAAANSYLRGLDLAEPEANAERLFYLEECARRLDDDGEVGSLLKEMAAKYPKSPWRLRAMLAVASRYTVTNRPDDFVPIYQAVAEDFPEDQAAPGAHWKVAFQAYFRDRNEAEVLLREHLRKYAWHPSAAGAMYFLGRQAERRNDFAGAAACYRRLATVFQNYYYGVLGRGRLKSAEVGGTPPSAEMTDFLAPLKFADTKPVVLEAVRPTSLHIDRSRVLRRAGFANLADAELRYGGRTDGQPGLLSLEIAAAAETPHQAMRFMKAMNPDYLNLRVEDAPRPFWQFLFPLPYRADLAANARDRGLDPYLVAGLIRQESEFDPAAISRANAYGMMQVRPVTGREFARRAGIQRLTNGMLFQPAVNLKLGTMIFRSMLDRNAANVEQTLAGYNAGPTRAREWIGWNSYREPAEFVETIPFNETRDYVQAVIRNADVYRRLYE